MLIDDALVVITNLCLLSLVIDGIVVLIKVIQRAILVRRWGCNFSGWWVPSITGFAEAILALCFDTRKN